MNSLKIWLKIPRQDTYHPAFTIFCSNAATRAARFSGFKKIRRQDTYCAKNTNANRTSYSVRQIAEFHRRAKQFRHCPACPGNPSSFQKRWIARIKRAMTVLICFADMSERR
jgi:hypothetical protein